MVPFLDWIILQDTEALLRLLENAEFFEPTDYNAVFKAELEKLAQRHNDPDVLKQIAALQEFDWGNYLARSLVRAGFRGDDVPEHFHDIVMRLLLIPGKLFTNWKPSKHGPLERRFRASTWNAIRNIVEKIRNRRERITLADPTVMAERNPARQPYSGVLEEFRKFVADRLGRLALSIFDWRMEGLDTKDLVNNADVGSPSVWQIKQQGSSHQSPCP